MPWWGWALIVLAAIVIAPVKLKILKKMLEKSSKGSNDF